MAFLTVEEQSRTSLLQNRRAKKLEATLSLRSLDKIVDSEAKVAFGGL